MKKIALFLAIAVAAIACEQEETVTPEVNVLSEAASLVIAQEGGDVLIDFEANVEWTAELKQAADWCTISPKSGAAGPNKVKVIAVENETNDNRTATVVIKAQTAVAEVVVTQLQKDALVISGEKTFAVPAEGGQVKFSVNHNLDINVTTDADWLVETKAMQTTEVVYGVAANTGAERTATITVTAGALKQTLTVTQAAWTPMFEVEPAADQWLAVEGGSVSVAVSANVEYTVTTDENDWLTVSNDGDVYTFTAGENASYDYRAVGVYVTPVDEAYAEFAKAFYVFQNGRAAKLWTKTVADLEGFDPAQRTKLAKYGPYLVVANTTKVYGLDPLTGEVAMAINMPEGFNAHNVLVDDAGNFLIASDVVYGETLALHYVADPFNPNPELVFSFDTNNYYGADCGNIRVRGNIKGEALITATISDGAGAANLFWEVTDGVCSTWYWTSVPYPTWTIGTQCAAPAGTKLSDGIFYIGYGGDYNLYYAGEVVKDGASNWVNSYTTGSSWMENYNAISTAEWNGHKYVAILAGCHFNYDDADAILLNVDDPAAAQHVYTYSGTNDVTRDESWANLNWTGAGTNSDILLYTAEDAIVMTYIDANYGALSSIAIK